MYIMNVHSVCQCEKAFNCKGFIKLWCILFLCFLYVVQPTKKLSEGSSSDGSASNQSPATTPMYAEAASLGDRNSS